MAHPHMCGIIGLVLNAVGAALLIWYPPRVTEYTPTGEWVPNGGPFSELPQNRYERQANVRTYRRHKNLFRLALVLVLMGLALQFYDLVIA